MMSRWNMWGQEVEKVVGTSKRGQELSFSKCDKEGRITYLVYNDTQPLFISPSYKAAKKFFVWTTSS